MLAVLHGCLRLQAGQLPDGKPQGPCNFAFFVWKAYYKEYHAAQDLPPRMCTLFAQTNRLPQHYSTVVERPNPATAFPKITKAIGSNFVATHHDSDRDPNLSHDHDLVAERLGVVVDNSATGAQ